MTETEAIIQRAQLMKKDGYRGPLAWARSIIDYVAALPAPSPETPRTTDALRDAIGQALSDNLTVDEISNQRDWFDSREIDVLVDAVMSVIAARTMAANPLWTSSPEREAARTMAAQPAAVVTNNNVPGERMHLVRSSEDYPTLDVGTPLYLAAPVAQADALDAARYRYLRDDTTRDADPDNAMYVGAPGGDDVLTGKQLDRQIDQAIAAQADGDRS